MSPRDPALSKLERRLLRRVTPERIYLKRREILRQLGLVGAGVLSGVVGCDRGDDVARPTTVRAEEQSPPDPSAAPEDVLARYPAPRSTAYRVSRAITPEPVASGYNNFYELSTDKEEVRFLAEGLRVRPWTVEVTGEVHRPRTFDVDQLVREMPLEERVYRFRCVEAWAMVVPWTGFPLRALLARVEPTSHARFVRFVTAEDEAQMPGIADQPWYPWPYREALRLDEANHELTLLATGIYGHPLPGQHGAPIRLVTPWKYGFKSIKSIVRIEVTREQPETFWNGLQPSEYGFYGNVDPAVPHPRWSQATERMIDTGARVPTEPYNGYGELVASMYRAMPTERIY